MKSKKLLGFTLIELLIVIAIIGILAVAFLPSLLNAPAKGRDTQRIADLQKIQKVLVSKDLEGKGYPITSGAISAGLDGAYVAGTNWGTTFTADFGGQVPTGPQDGETYNYYVKGSAQAGTYSFGLLARMETIEAANAPCPAENAAIVLGAVGEGATPCYAILMQ